MHRHLCQELLQQQIDAANRGPIRARLDEDISRQGARALAIVSGPDRRYVLELEGENYDAEPLRLRLLDDETREPLPVEAWPQGLGAAEHPSLKRPFTCMRGLFEYHCHTSHLNDPWDRHRYDYRVEDLLRRLLDKAAL